MPAEPDPNQAYLELLEGMKQMVDLANTLKEQFMQAGWSDRNAEKVVIAIYRQSR